jgi:cardiolipin synthase
MTEIFANYWHYLTALIAFVDVIVVAVAICWILQIKKEPTAALAWCLLVILVPIFGVLLFLIFGYQNVYRPLNRKKLHRQGYRARRGASKPARTEPSGGYEGLGRLAERLNASPTLPGNSVTLFHDGRAAFDSVFREIEAARSHVHLAFFIFRTDRLGRRLLDLLADKARAGVEVRLLTDGIGARKFGRRDVRGLKDAGGQWSSFLPVSLWRRRIQLNLRNHRKIVVVDGRVAFTGGLNVGDEYLGECPAFGAWRDSFFRLEGPAVEPVQQVFVEDWDFAAGETLDGPTYFPPPVESGGELVQIISSGPDDDTKSIRELYFAAILKARKRLWIATPYYVPDAGIRDGLALAAMTGVDVRLLIPQFPDHWTPYFASRYFLPDLLAAGVKVYSYVRGFMHAKVVLVDGKWASVGSANLDNRSLLLNFELNGVFHSPGAVGEVERQFLMDLEDAVRLDARTFAQREWPGRLAENVCRLFAPVL